MVDTSELSVVETTIKQMCEAGIRCLDANKSLFDLTLKYHLLYILGGGYGRKIEIKAMAGAKH